MIEDTIKLEHISSLSLPANNEIEADERLVQAVLAGDEAAFNLIFERYRRLVVHLVSRFFRQRAEVEDITQQAFAKIYFSLKDFRGGHEKSFSAWASRLTINACYDELRRRGRRSENLFSEFSEAEREHLEQIATENSTDAEKSLVTRDLAEKILSRLDTKERLALTLLHGEDFSVSEVARIVGWSESNVKTRLFRCRNNLRNIFSHLFNR
jgi:RNA polymerase sigma-70 factor (ECF subfamily)